MRNDKRNYRFEGLAQFGEAVYRTIGPQCEVVIHDLSDMEHSIVWIRGSVTERKVGGCMTSRGLSLFHSGRTAGDYNYTTRTRSGKMVRSSLIFIRDEDGRAFASVEINFDTSAFVAFRNALETLAEPDDAYDFQDAFIDDAPEMIETMLSKATDYIGKSTARMNKADRLRAVHMLDEAGAFELRKAIPAVAAYLGVTRFTIHNYLKEIRKKSEADTVTDHDIE